MLKFKVVITNLKGNKKSITIKAVNIMSCENNVVENYLQKTEDGTTALISHGKDRMTLITKDKTKKHWNHDGYRFSG